MYEEMGAADERMDGRTDRCTSILKDVLTDRQVSRSSNPIQGVIPYPYGGIKVLY